SRSTPPLLLRTVTLACGTVAPEGSFTNPEIFPRSDCPQLPGTHKAAQTANAPANTPTEETRLLRIITPPQTGFRQVLNWPFALYGIAQTRRLTLGKRKMKNHSPRRVNGQPHARSTRASHQPAPGVCRMPPKSKSGKHLNAHQVYSGMSQN